MKILRTALCAVTASLCLFACAVPESEGGDIGDEESALTSANATGGCAASRDAILASAPSAGRKKAIQRGFTWLDANVPYSQSKSHQGYRTDCSGFVSMCWELGSSLTTATFVGSNANSKLLPSFDSLAPGDAMVYRSGGAGHIVLFLGWNDKAKSGACVLEQASTASDMQFRVRSTSSLKSQGYKAIRAAKLANDATDVAPGPLGGEEDMEAPLPMPRPTTPNPTPVPTPTPTPAPEPNPLPLPVPGGGGQGGGACFESCIAQFPAADRYDQCSMSCTNIQCDDQCYAQFCGNTATCDAQIAQCQSSCGF